MSIGEYEVPQEPCARPTDVQDTLPASLVLEGFLRREELAQQLGLSPRTIDRWEALRIGPPRVHIGRTILYSIQSVREWLLSREKQLLPAKRDRVYPGTKPGMRSRFK